MSKVTATATAELLERLEQGDTVQAIADAMGIRRQSLYRHRQADQAFRDAWIEAAVMGAKLSSKIWKRKLIAGLWRDGLSQSFIEVRRSARSANIVTGY